MPSQRYTHYYYGALILFITLHIYIAIVASPPPSNRLGLSPMGTLALRLSILPIYWLAWFFGVRSVIAVREYARSFLASSPHYERGLRWISYGLLALVLNLALAATIGGMRNFFPVTSPATMWITIITNYLYVIFPLGGLWLMYFGAHLVSDPTLTAVPRKRDNIVIATIFSTTIAILYGFLVFTNPDRSISHDPTIRAAYYLSDPLIVCTILVPTFFIWLLGMLAAFQLDKFSPKVFSQRQLLARRRFINGIWAVIFATTSIHIILALGGPRLIDLGLAFVLLVVYFVILLLAYAYYMVMRGARGLSHEGEQVPARKDAKHSRQKDNFY